MSKTSELTEVYTDTAPSLRGYFKSDVDKLVMRLETELKKANKLLLKTNQTHIENQQLQKDLDGEREINQRLTDELSDARAEIARLSGVVMSQIAPEPFMLSSYSESAEPVEHTKDKLIEQMRDALQWYKEQVSSCNRNGDAGELARDRLAKDVGKRAEAALSAAERGE